MIGGLLTGGSGFKSRRGSRTPRRSMFSRC